jgi:hypothetical protein
MYRYKNNQPVRVHIPDATAIVDPGEEYDSLNEIINETQEPVNDEAKAAAVARLTPQPQEATE